MLTRSIALGLLAALIWAQDPPPPVAYRVYAIHYATLADFPVASLVAGADRARRADIAMMLWLIRSRDGRIVLFDSGFYGDQYLKQWNPQQFVRPDEAIARFLGSMAMDLDVASYPRWDDLLGYMDGSAAVIGEMMLPVLEPLDHAAAFQPARDLGLAFQLTNFLRDIDEDLDRGRLAGDVRRSEPGDDAIGSRRGCGG